MHSALPAFESCTKRSAKRSLIVSIHCALVYRYTHKALRQEETRKQKKDFCKGKCVLYKIMEAIDVEDEQPYLVGGRSSLGPR
jgi:hypothetical protein